MLRRFLTAGAYGLITEAVIAALSACLVHGHIGSCGPTNTTATIGWFLQYPGLWLMGRLEYYTWFFERHSLVFPSVFFVQAVVWSCVWFAGGMAVLRHAHPHGTHNSSDEVVRLARKSDL